MKFENEELINLTYLGIALLFVVGLAITWLFWKHTNRTDQTILLKQQLITAHSNGINIIDRERRRKGREQLLTLAQSLFDSPERFADVENLAEMIEMLARNCATIGHTQGDWDTITGRKYAAEIIEMMNRLKEKTNKLPPTAGGHSRPSEV